MAKLHGAAKAKFLARMARGRKKTARRSKRTNPRRRGKGRRTNPLYARYGIDRGERVYTSMLERRANPRKRKRRRTSRKRARARARRRNPVAYLVNPTGGTMARRRRRKTHARKTHARKRRHHLRPRRHHRRSRRRNPSLLGGLNLKAQLVPAGAALAGGFVGGLVDAKLSAHGKPVRMIAQGVLGLVGGAVVSKVAKSAIAGASFMGSVVGGATRMWGEKVGGGVAGMEEMAALAGSIAENEQMATLLNANLQGYGLLLAPSAGGGGVAGMAGADLDALTEEPA